VRRVRVNEGDASDFHAYPIFIGLAAKEHKELKTSVILSLSHAHSCGRIGSASGKTQQN